MKNYYIITGILLLILMAIESANGNQNSIKVKEFRHLYQQDSLWNNISGIETELSVFANQIKKLPQEEKDCKMNLFFDSVWNDGISRWRKSPNDIRRYKWFLWITRHPPRFYNSLTSTVNLERQNLWFKEYAEMTKEYFDCLVTKPEQQRTRSMLEYDHLKLQGDLELAMVNFKTTGKKLELSEFQNRAINLAKEMRGTDFFFPFTQSLDMIFSNTKYFGLNDKMEVSTFLSYLKKNGNVELANWASGKENLIAMKNLTFDYSFQTLDGNTYDINQKRGKVLLVDFWATWCGTCISKMPMIKEVSEMYKDQGFEVLSISINKESEKEKVLAVEERIGTDWPLSIIGNTLIKNEIWKRFAFTSVPQLLLLGKDGKLIESNGELFYKESLEKLVKKALEN